MSRIEIRSADHRDLRILRIICEQLFAERKKAGVRKTIVFQNYRLFHLTEDPVKPFRHILPESDILFGKAAENLTWPINLFDNRARRRALARVAFHNGPRPVRDHKQLRWTRG